MHVKDFVKENTAGHCYRVTGDDLYWSDLAARYFENLIDTSARDFDYTKIERLNNAQQLYDALTKSPMMGDKTVVLVCGCDAALKSTEDKLVSFLSSVPEDCVLAFLPTEFLPKKAEPMLTEISAARLSSAEIKDEVRALFAAGIEDAAVRTLIEYTNRDMRRIKNEAVKLNAYTGGKFVRADDVRELVAADTETQVFEFQNFAERRDKRGAYRVMERLLKRGEEPQFLLYTLLGQYRRLLYGAISPLSDADLAKQLNVKEYAIKKARESARCTKPVKIKAMFDRLTELEYRARSGKLNISTALDLAVESILEG